MTISHRLMRAGLACLVFGTCAYLLPSNNGIEMANAASCNNATSSNSAGRTAAVVGGSAVLLFLAQPSLFGVSGGGLFGSGAAGLAAFDPSTEMFQFIYDPTGPGS